MSNITERLQDEADQCRNDGAEDVARLLSDAASAIDSLRTQLAEARAEAEALRKDAERYRWLRAEHERHDPICRLVWKRNGDRSSGEWVNTARLDSSIDLAIQAARERAVSQHCNERGNDMDLHDEIMNLPASPLVEGWAPDERHNYKMGHRDARHAAAEAASVHEAACVAPLRARVEWLESALQHIAASCPGRAAEVAAAALAGRELVSG